MRHLIIILLLTLSACGSVQQKHQTKTHIRETGIRIRKVEKDSVVYVPRVVYKDTTVVVENRHVKLLTRYGSAGKVIKVTCEQKPQTEVEKYTRTTETTEKEKQTERRRIIPEYNMENMAILFVFVAGLIIINHLLKKLL